MTSSPDLVLIVFDRADLTAETLRRILACDVGRIWVVGDGPRANVPQDEQNVAAVRKVVDEIGGQRVETDYAETNLGLRRNYVRAVDRLMGEHGRGLVLEDDTVPHPTFFPFAGALLARFESDERVGSVCGQGFPSGGDHSYGFSHLPPPWGWGTWARAWKAHATALHGWPELKASGQLERKVGAAAAREWTALLDHAETTDSYWIRWVLAHWLNNWVAAVPHTNLIENVGFDDRGTFTTRGSSYAGRGSPPAEAMSFPLDHPRFMGVRPAADEQRWSEEALPFPAAKRRLKQLVLEGPLAAWRAGRND